MKKLQVIVRGDLDRLSFEAYYCSGNKVEAVCQMGGKPTDPVLVACGELMKRGQMLTRDEVQLGVSPVDVLRKLNEKERSSAPAQ